MLSVSIAGARGNTGNDRNGGIGAAAILNKGAGEGETRPGLSASSETGDAGLPPAST